MKKGNRRKGISHAPTLILAALAAGLLLRAGGALSGGLWLDEFQSFWICSGKEFGSVIGRCAAQMTQFPLFYLLERASLDLFGRSEWSIRLVSILSGTAAIAAVFFLARRVFDRWSAATAAMIAAMAAAQVNFGAWGRPYALMILLGALSTIAYLRWIEKPTLTRLAAYLLAAVLLEWTHVLTLPLLAAQILHFLLAGRRRAPAAPFLCALTAAGVCLVPLLPQVLALSRNGASFTYRGLTLDGLAAILDRFVETKHLAVIVAVLFLLGILGLFGPSSGKPRAGVGEKSAGKGRDGSMPESGDGVGPGGGARLLVGAWIATALGLPLLVLLFTGASVFSDYRYFALLAIPADILLGRLMIAAARLFTRPITERIWLVPLVYALLYCGLARGVEGEHFFRTEPFEDWRAALADLERNARDGESVYLFTGYVESNDALFVRDPLLREYLQGPLAGFYPQRNLECRILPADPFDPRHQKDWRGPILKERGRFWMLGRNWPGFVEEVKWCAGKLPRRFRAAPLEGRGKGYAGGLVLLECFIGP